LARCRDNDEAAAIVHEVLMALDSERERELVWARLQGRSYREIARGTSETETVLRSRWACICRKLT
jgi:DNA-directed RNA polymerase specialized sigma24 family protein